MRIGGQVIPVTLGRGGILANKHEGDGRPRAECSIRCGCGGAAIAPRVRAHRYPCGRSRRPTPGAKIPPTGATIATFVLRVTHAGDRLMRADHLYDFIVEIDHNTRPRIARRGSAVFIHLARENWGPTAGCVGLKRNDMLRLLAKLTTRTKDRNRAWMVQPPRPPKIAEPTRTCVAPSMIASSKSALMPIDSSFNPLRAAIFAVSAKCGDGPSSTGGMHIRPDIVRP